MRAEGYTASEVFGFSLYVQFTRFRKIAGYAIPLMRSSKADNAALAPSPIAMTICL